MKKLYEGMFLVDNDLVREDWARAKGSVTDLLEKHGAELKTVRRFAERKLAYPIKRRLRGTYILAYFEGDGAFFPALHRDLDLSEHVLRYLMLSVDVIPEEEAELSEAEKAPDFMVPPPPLDDAPDESDLIDGVTDGDEDEEFVTPDLSKEDDGPAKPATAEASVAAAATPEAAEPTKEG